MKEKSNKGIFIDNKDEENHKIICKIGEGSTSNVFKVIDERTSLVMCKKVIKPNSNENSFKLMKTSLKEIEVLLLIHDPNICKGIGINIQEEMTNEIHSNSFANTWNQYKSKRN